ncbi:MAG: hypothetical protein V7745_07580 [Pseudomonadales bacterium]
MAKSHIDATVLESTDDFTVTGSATVTGAVRLAWDDTLPKNDLIVLIKRISERVIRELG